MRNAGWTPLPADAASFVADTRVLPVETRSGGVRIEFVFTFTPFERQSVEHARPVDFGAFSIPVVRAEDLIVYKVFAGRPRDLDDARSVILKHPALDADYIAQALSELSGDGRDSLVARFRSVRDSARVEP